MLSLRVPCLICVLALAVTPVFATAIPYSDRSSWLNASSGVSTDGFDGLAPVNGSTAYTTGLVLPDGTTFHGFNGSFDDLWVKNGSYWDYGSGPILVGPACCGPNLYIQIALPHPVTSVGFDLMAGGGNNTNYNIAVNNQNYIYSSVPTLGLPNRVFWGITSDTPINFIDIALPSTAPNGTAFELDNFSYGTATIDTGDGGSGGSGTSDTPEACSLLLIGTGLVGLRLFRRRLRSVVQAF